MYAQLRWTKHESFDHLEEARLSVFKYIETFYDRVRVHQTLGYKSPDQYEADYATTTVAKKTPRPVSVNLGPTQTELLPKLREFLIGWNFSGFIKSEKGCSYPNVILSQLFAVRLPIRLTAFQDPRPLP